VLSRTVSVVASSSPICGGSTDVLASPPDDSHPRREPDVVRLGVERADATFDVLSELDGRYLSTEVAGGFTGRVIGMYAAGGTVGFDWFDYEPVEPPSPA